MFKGLLYDAKEIRKRDPAARNIFEVCLLYSGFHALIYHRVANFFYRRRWFLTARFISQTSRFFTGIEIHPGAQIGKGLFIDHGMGIVIGETAQIGNNCTIYHNVTLGGTGKDSGKRHPTIGDNVLIACGAKILGPFNVGNNCNIGANSVVLSGVPDNCTVVGVPGKIVKRDGENVQSRELDHIHNPDPISFEICQILQRILKLEKNFTKTQE